MLNKQNPILFNGARPRSDAGVIETNWILLAERLQATKQKKKCECSLSSNTKACPLPMCFKDGWTRALCVETMFFLQRYEGPFYATPISSTISKAHAPTWFESCRCVTTRVVLDCCRETTASTKSKGPPPLQHAGSEQLFYSGCVCFLKKMFNVNGWILWPFSSPWAPWLLPIPHSNRYT